MYVCVYSYAYEHTHRYTHIHTYIHIHTSGFENIWVWFWLYVGVRILITASGPDQNNELSMLEGDDGRVSPNS